MQINIKLHYKEGPCRRWDTTDFDTHTSSSLLNQVCVGHIPQERYLREWISDAERQHLTALSECEAVHVNEAVLFESLT